MTDADTPAKMADVSFLLSPSLFHSVPVHPGDILVFKQSVVHHGVMNPNHEDRIILFDILSSKMTKAQDKYQYYIWMWMRDAHGANSPQFAEALMEWKSQKPVARYGKQAAIESAEGIDEMIAQAETVRDAADQMVKELRLIKEGKDGSE